MSDKTIIKILPLANRWPCTDPFLFCAYHLDDYPVANGKMGPVGSLAGRNIGQDFDLINGWNMYHGDSIPGFPQHPHRGFETVTFARKGLVDHSDSLGATARFGHGDVQWITAGKGISHSEMFPLLNDSEKNPLDLFQIWLNLPKKSKFVEPHFSIFWEENVPKLNLKDSAGKNTQVTLIAGTLNNVTAPPSPPSSWASDASSDLAIWTLKLDAGAQFTIPKTNASSNRILYFFKGSSIQIADKSVPFGNAIQVKAESDVLIQNGNEEAEILMLQGKPLNEPVAQHGPFVMNTPQEIQEAFADYQKTGFGGWPWKDDAPVHSKTEVRFAKYPDGRIEKKS